MAKNGQDSVILVDEHDSPVGVATKLAAHRGKGLLHRAFSVFVFDRRGRLLIQKRAGSKYHFAGVWANTCCSHPRPGESVMDAAHRRLVEEMGFDCSLSDLFSFVYRAVSPNGLVEHEFDHILTGRFNGSAKPDLAEVAEWKWMTTARLLRDMERNPSEFAPWFKASAPTVISEMRHAAQRASGSHRPKQQRKTLKQKVFQTK